MAKMRGHQSRYLTKKAENSRMIALVFVILICILLFVILEHYTYFSRHPYTWLIFAGIFVIFFLFKYAGDKLLDRSDKFIDGRKGESAVYFELKTLPHEYSVFQDLHFNGQQFNIDFVVVGPTGVFTIEVKSHRNGEVHFKGQELTWNGQPFQEKNILKQAKGEAFALSNYLKEKLGKGVYVQPIIVFANYVKIHFGKHPVQDVIVVGKDWLNQIITESRQTLPANEVNKVSEVLEELVSK